MKPIRTQKRNGVVIVQHHLDGTEETFRGVNLTFDDDSQASAFVSDKREGYFSRVMVPFGQEVPNVVSLA